MTSLISLTLESVSYQLPDGSLLFDNLHEQFDRRHTGLVGRNGIGKSVLARILNGDLPPSAGRCTRNGSTYYLAQRISAQPGQTIADLAGVQDIIDALERIESGSTSQSDFETVGERWDIRQRLQQELTIHRLAHLQTNTPIAALSGGEAMRVALLGAFLAQADFLILDEPTNHLDGDNRRALQEQLQHWPNGLIVISHDRALLENMERIIELSTLGLHSYGGGYSFYAQTKAEQQANAAAQLQQRKAEYKRGQRLLQEQRERIEHRQARGKKQAGTANQAKILLGGQRQRSENSAGKLSVKQQQQRETLSTRLREASQQVEDDTALVLYTPAAESITPNKIAELDNVELPFIDGAAKKIDLIIGRGQRIGLVGANGSGKSTVLRILAGLCLPLSGQCKLFVKTAYLDQQLSVLNPDLSTLQQVLAVNAALGEAGVRTRLAQLGLDAQRIVLPTRLLSGGERLKSALASVLYADHCAQLLLLDEPNNHLDLAALQALENMLRQYRGTLVVVSHDEVFLNNLELTANLVATPDGWQFNYRDAAKSTAEN